MIGDHQARGLSSQGISLHVCGVRPRLHQGEPRAGQSTSGTHLGRGHNTWREPPRRQTLDHPRGIVPVGLFARTLLDLSTLGQMHINRWAQHMGHRLPMHPVRSKATTGHWGTCSRFRKATRTPEIVSYATRQETRSMMIWPSSLTWRRHAVH